MSVLPERGRGFALGASDYLVKPVSKEGLLGAVWRAVAERVDQSSSRRDIVVIDDDPGVRESLRDLLEIEGYRVRTAEHGLAGLQQIESSGAPCLVLLDLMMPIMNGLQFLDALRRHADAAVSRTRVTVLSALDEGRELVSSYECQVMRKPLDVGALLALVQHHCVR